MTCEGWKEMTFRVSLLQREKEIAFRVGDTVTERDGCIKVKPAVSQVGDTRYFMNMILKGELSEKSTQDEGLLRRIENDLGILKIVDHNHIVKLFQMFNGPSTIYVIMEYTPFSIGEIISSSGALEATQARNYFIQLIKALDYLHERALVHRGISPDTILLDESKDMVKLSDFTVATVQHSRELLSDHPKDLDHSYCSPEILDTSCSYHGKKTDIWSSACLLSYMLTASTPTYNKNTTPENVQEVLSKGTDNAPELHSVMQKMLDPNWKTRMNLQDLRKSDYVDLGEGCGAFLIQRHGSVEELEKATETSLQQSFLKVGKGLESPLIDNTFSPLDGPRQKPVVTLLDTPCIGTLSPNAPPPSFELSPASSPASKTGKLLKVNILNCETDVDEEELVTSPMNGQ